MVRVDGVLARAAPDAPWSFDTTLSYVSSAQPSFAHSGMLSLGVLGYPDSNHDSVMLLSFFGLAVLAVNAVSLDPHCKDDGTVITRKPPFFLRMLGMLALLEPFPYPYPCPYPCPYPYPYPYPYPAQGAVRPPARVRHRLQVGRG